MRKSTLAERRGPGLGLLILVAAAGAFSHAAQADPAVQPNFVQQSDSGRYFQLEDGSDFLPIGHNESWVAPGMRTLTVSSLYYDLQAAREYFNKLRNHGVNVIRIWVDMPTASSSGTVSPWRSRPASLTLKPSRCSTAPCNWPTSTACTCC